MSETVPMTLTEFLLARFQDEEFAAQAAMISSPHWKPYYDGASYREVRDDDGQIILLPVGECPTQQAAEHIARHDPARVLAEYEAKRRIVERHTGKHLCPEPEDDEWTTMYIAGQPVVITRPCGDLRDLAAPYADHPDYREEWKP